jgi:hypothetical protein
MTEKTDKAAKGGKSVQPSDKPVTPAEIGKRDRRVTGLRRR